MKRQRSGIYNSVIFFGCRASGEKKDDPAGIIAALQLLYHQKPRLDRGKGKNSWRTEAAKGDNGADVFLVGEQCADDRQALIDLYGKLAVAEQEIASGAEGKDFLTLARQLRERVHGTV